MRLRWVGSRGVVRGARPPKSHARSVRLTEAVGILLVDDEQRNLDALAAVLDDPRYELHMVNDAEAALRLMLKQELAIAILGVQMPQVDGFELARLIKGTKKFREVRIFFLTAHLPDGEDAVAGYDAGGVDYLVKPPIALRMRGSERRRKGVTTMKLHVLALLR